MGRVLPCVSRCIELKQRDTAVQSFIADAQLLRCVRQPVDKRRELHEITSAESGLGSLQRSTHKHGAIRVQQGQVPLQKWADVAPSQITSTRWHLRVFNAPWSAANAPSAAMPVSRQAQAIYKCVGIQRAMCASFPPVSLALASALTLPCYRTHAALRQLRRGIRRWWTCWPGERVTPLM